MASKTSKTQDSKTPTQAQREQVLALNAEGTKFGDIVAATGLSAAAVDRIIDHDRAHQRLAALDVAGVRESCMAWLGVPTLGNYLHDAPYKALAEYTRDADLSYSEFKPVADAALAARSDEAAVAVLTEARDGMAERIAAIEAGTWRKPVAARAARPVSAEVLAASVASMSDEQIAALKEALAAR